MALSSGAGSPLGRYAPLAATVITVVFVVAAVGVHVWADTHPGVAPDAWLDTTALVVVGIVMGIGAIGGTAASALDTARMASSLAVAAHQRLDTVAAPAAATTPDAQSVVAGAAFDAPGSPQP